MANSFDKDAIRTAKMYCLSMYPKESSKKSIGAPMITITVPKMVSNRNPLKDIFLY